MDHALKSLLAGLNETAVWIGTEVTAADQRNVFGTTPLHVTAAWGDVDATRLLLDVGVDVNARGEDDDTPLYWALMGNNPAVVELLLQRGADMMQRNNSGWSVLEDAIESKCDEKIIELLSSGRDHNVLTSRSADMSRLIRPATPADVATILDLIRELAAYEREPDAVHATVASLTDTLFGPRPHAECLVAEASGRVAGLALFFTNFSTWSGKPGLYLEDLYVSPAARGLGLGRALLQHLAGLTVERNYARLEWSVLDWNEAAIGFYKSLGAKPMDQWTVFRLDGDALAALAAGRGSA